MARKVSFKKKAKGKKKPETSFNFGFNVAGKKRRGGFGGGS